jgi:hypothetical protein
MPSTLTYRTGKVAFLLSIHILSLAEHSHHRHHEDHHPDTLSPADDAQIAEAFAKIPNQVIVPSKHRVQSTTQPTNPSEPTQSQGPLKIDPHAVVPKKRSDATTSSKQAKLAVVEPGQRPSSYRYESSPIQQALQSQRENGHPSSLPHPKHTPDAHRRHQSHVASRNDELIAAASRELRQLKSDREATMNGDYAEVTSNKKTGLRSVDDKWHDIQREEPEQEPRSFPVSSASRGDRQVSAVKAKNGVSPKEPEVKFGDDDQEDHHEGSHQKPSEKEEDMWLAMDARQRVCHVILFDHSSCFIAVAFAGNGP